MLGKFIERMRGWWSGNPPKVEKKPRAKKASATPKPAKKPRKTVEGNASLLGIERKK